MGAASQQREQRQHHPPRAELVGVERLLDDREVGGRRPLPRVVVDRRVVDEAVDVVDAAGELVRCGRDAVRVADVDDEPEHVATQPVGDIGHVTGVTAR